MEVIQQPLMQLTSWVQPHLWTVSMAILATLLVLFGADLNRAVQELVKRLHFIFRVAIFTLVCAFGYGLLVEILTPLLAELLALGGRVWTGPLVIVALLGLGVLAERRHYGG